MRAAGIVVFTALATIAVASSPFDADPRLIWNASASVPVGFYTLSVGGSYQLADLVAVRVDGALADFLLDRAYLGRDVPLLKRILAMAGQTVCRHGSEVAIDGIVVGRALERDRAGRSLPVWQGCRGVAADQLFLMNRDVPDSLDGRYFGMTPIDRVIGRALPLWTDELGNGRFQWRARTR